MARRRRGSCGQSEPECTQRWDRNIHRAEIDARRGRILDRSRAFLIRRDNTTLQNSIARERDDDESANARESRIRRTYDQVLERSKDYHDVTGRYVGLD